MSKDQIFRGTAHNNSFRIFAAESTATVQKARDLHDLSPLSTILLSRLLTSVAMMSWELKQPQAEITMRVDAEGALAGGVAICTAEGYLRGYAHNPSLYLADKADNFLIGKALGKGTLSIQSNAAEHKAYTGTCKLVSGEIGDDLAYYYQQSEQVPSAVNLGILIDKDAVIRSAGGFIIQQLPYADPATSEIIQANLLQTPNLSDLMDMGLSIPEVFSRFVFKDIQWQINETREISFHCLCSRDRFTQALLLLGKEELVSMHDGIKPVCHYCNTEYVFNHDDMINMIKLL